jgi:hypothetical protein
MDERRFDFAGSITIRYHHSTQGPLAHLVERLHGMQEVAGSIPAGSTTELSSVGVRNDKAELCPNPTVVYFSEVVELSSTAISERS